MSARSFSLRRRAIPAVHVPTFGCSRIALGADFFVVAHRQTDKRVYSFFLITAARDSRRSAPIGVSDGTRTRDVLDHNQVLYQLSYTHHANGPR